MFTNLLSIGTIEFVSMPKPKPFVSYYYRMYRCTTRIFCPHCNASMLPKHFESHCVTHHNFDQRTRCVWCQSKSWPAGEKLKHGQHLSTCFKQSLEKISNLHDDDPFDFLNDAPDINNHQQQQPPSPPSIPDAFTSQCSSFNQSTSFNHSTASNDHPFPERDFFDHRMTHPDPMIQSLQAFLDTPVQPLRLEDLPPLRVPFADDNLNFAARCVLLYLKGTHDFFHVMVKLSVWESFREAMDEDRSCRMLPFSCWCDGGPYEEAPYRQHRHAIVVSPRRRNHFESSSVWRKVKLPRGTRPPKRNFPCKKCKKIITPLYLVNVIGYVSQRKSRCNFTFVHDRRKPMKNCHFYLYKTLPADCKLHLCLLWNNGILQLLKQTKFQNVSVARLAQGILTHNGRKWTQKIKDFYKHERGLVIQVARNYVPVTDDRITTPHYLWLAEGRKLYFEKTPPERPPLDPSVWLRKQIEGGNQFYDAVQECKWIPRQRDQKILNFHKPVVERCKELEAEVAEWKNKDKNTKSQMEELIREKDKIIEELKLAMQQKIETLESEIKELRRTSTKKDENHARTSIIISRNVLNFNLQ